MVIQAKFDADIFGFTVKQRRKQKEWSQTQLAVLIGVNKSTIENIEAGISVPHITTAIALCHALEIDIRAFWRVERVGQQ